MHIDDLLCFPQACHLSEIVLFGWNDRIRGCVSRAVDKLHLARNSRLVLLFTNIIMCYFRGLLNLGVCKYDPIQVHYHQICTRH